MAHFEVTESEAELTAWIYIEEGTEDFVPVRGEPDPANLALKLKHLPPRSAEALQRRMLGLGIIRKKVIARDVVDVECVKGREFDRDRLYAEAYVADWQGFVKEGKPLAYSPEELAILMARVTWLNIVLGKAVKEFESFFARNGNAS